MKFGHIEILAKDVMQSVDFYQNVLGFEVTVEQGPHLVWLQKGELEILIRPGVAGNTSDKYEQARTGFVLYTDDVYKKKTELEARGLEFRGTVDSERCFTFTDPNGNWFQLVNPEDH
jgi:catechol 2,3-dioxygenase-like lactoylglutathione lyase family enzyme